MYDNFISWSITKEFTCFTTKRTRDTIANNYINAFSVSAMTNLYISLELRSLSKHYIYCAELPNNINISAYQR